MWKNIKMESSFLWVISLFYVVSSEWVEITPIESRRSEVKPNILLTTPSSYEMFMKAPFRKDEYLFTTPIYKFVTPTEPDDMLYNYSKNTVLSSSLKMNTTPFSTSEDIPEAIEQRENEEDDLQPSNISFEGFVPFLKMVQESLFKYKSRKSKMSLLKHLRDHLLENIKERITSIWNPKTTFEARGYKDEDSHMDFPSNEGALMTIGFLTFAVFLIKLVIKLVHALKYKQQYYGMATTTTAASVVFLKRKKRDEANEAAAKILQYIEEF